MCSVQNLAAFPVFSSGIIITVFVVVAVEFSPYIFLGTTFQLTPGFRVVVPFSLNTCITIMYQKVLSHKFLYANSYTYSNKVKIFKFNELLFSPPENLCLLHTVINA
jgi:hypothetical protein